MGGNIDSDKYFELMIRNAWHISGGTGQAANTSCRRVLVIHCVVLGGLWMNGKKEDDVNVSNLTLRKSKGCGVSGLYWNNGASMHLDNVSVENSGQPTRRL